VRKYVISENFFKSIAKKGNLYSRIWFYWLGEFVDEVFDDEFIEKQVKSLPKMDESEIREIYQFGVQTLRQDFKIIGSNKSKPKNPVDKDKAKIAKEVIEYLNSVAFTTFRSHGKGSESNVDFIVARINEGFTISDFKIVIDNKVKDWLGSEQAKYLRPSTLFIKSKFENYLNINNGAARKPASNFDTFTASVAKAAETLRLRRESR